MPRYSATSLVASAAASRRCIRKDTLPWVVLDLKLTHLGWGCRVYHRTASAEDRTFIAAMESQAVETSVLTTVLSRSDAQYIQRQLLGSSITASHLPVVGFSSTLNLGLQTWHAVLLPSVVVVHLWHLSGLPSVGHCAASLLVCSLGKSNCGWLLHGGLTFCCCLAGAPASSQVRHGEPAAAPRHCAEAAVPVSTVRCNLAASRCGCCLIRGECAMLCR